MFCSLCYAKQFLNKAHRQSKKTQLTRRTICQYLLQQQYFHAQTRDCMICTKTFRILILNTVLGTFPDLDTCHPCSFPHTGIASGASIAWAASAWAASAWAASTALVASAASTAAWRTCPAGLELRLVHFLMKVVLHLLGSFSARYA